MRLIPIWILAATIGTLVACGGSSEAPKDDEPTEEAADDAKSDEGEADEADEADDAEEGGDEAGGQICCAIERDGKKMRRRTTSDECKNRGGEEMPLDKCPERSKAPGGKRSKH